MQDLPKSLQQLVHMLEQTEEVEYSCDEVYRLLELFVEGVLRGEHAAQMMPLVQKHLEKCPDCREEYEALLRVMQATAPHLPKRAPL